MAYEIRKSDGTFLVSVNDGTVNTTKTTIKLIGRAFPNYGDELNTNMVHMLEHFASSVSPSNPLIGQIWMDTFTGILKFWNGTAWTNIVSVGSGAAGFVEISGDTMTGDLVMDASALNVDGAAGSSRELKLRTSSSVGQGRRWVISANSDTESGSNAGSNFAISRWSDSDAVITEAMSINRATGVLNFNGGRLTNIGTPVAANDAATKQYVDTVSGGSGGGGSGGGAISAGAIIASAGPLGSPFLLCNGQAVSRTTYAELFIKIGTTYGAGDGSTTFNVPNLSDRFVVGTGTYTVGDIGGEDSVTLTEAQMPSHTHTGGVADSSGSHTHTGTAASAGSHTHTVDGSNSSGKSVSDNNNGAPFVATFNSETTSASGTHSHTLTINSAGAHSHTISGLNSTGSGNAHENRPPYMALNWYIITQAIGGDVSSGGGGTGSGADIGDVKTTATLVPPSGWLSCNGAAVSRTTYAALYTAIGDTYGAGDGSTTFNVPDMQGRTAIGVGSGAGLTSRALGDTGGAEEHTLTEDEMPSHKHQVKTISGGGQGSGPATGTGLTVISGNWFTENTGSDEPHENMQPFVALNYIIYTGV